MVNIQSVNWYMLASMISYNIPMVDVDLDQGLFSWLILILYLNCSLVVFLKIVFVILNPPPHPGSRSIKVG